MDLEATLSHAHFAPYAALIIALYPELGQKLGGEHYQASISL
jgi:hypothetical protein